MGRDPKGNEYSNHPLSGAMLVSGRVSHKAICLKKRRDVFYEANVFFEAEPPPLLSLFYLPKAPRDLVFFFQRNQDLPKPSEAKAAYADIPEGAEEAVFVCGFSGFFW